MKFKSLKLLAIVFIVTAVSIGKPCHADIIHLKNGQELEGLTREAPNGIYIDGVLFDKGEIKHIERKELKRKASVGKWT